MKRQNISSGAVWEDTIGYSRAVRIGNVVEVAGTTATNGDEVIGKGSPYEQTRYVLQKIEQALQQAGATLQDVVRTRIYVTDIRQWEEIGRAHGEFFRSIKPASTMVEVKALINPEQLVEIEATAILSTGGEDFVNPAAVPYGEE
ncbi:MAG: RidA family protein [Hymenobacteraceae bacterium]|nr:RidA family protein [Hymenobacteraceae bacterium]